MNWKMNTPKDNNLSPFLRIGIALLALALVMLAGCQGQSLLDSVFPGSDELLDATSTPVVAEEEDVATQQATATLPSNVQLLLWIPPQFSPYEETESAELLSEQLKAFMTDNPQVNLDVRVKAASGAASMIDTLTYASQVAPDALPSLVLLSRSDMETAASKGLLQPIEELSSTIDESDWYQFAQSMGIVQGTAYGLPFAADALGLVYRNASLTSSQPDWNEANAQFDSLVFPAADPTILSALALYLSAGGSVQDPQGQAFIDVDALTLTLEAYAQGRNSGLFSSSLLDLTTDDQSWEFFQTNNADGLISWASRQLQDEDELKLALLPTLGESSITLAKGWVWCLVEQEPIEKEYAALLIEHLVDPEFLSQWAPLSGYLPVRPSSISSWESTITQDTISNMLLSAQLRPNTSQVTSFNTGIKTALQEVLQGQSDPAASAQKAADSLLEVAE